MLVADFEVVIGNNGTGRNSGIYAYTFIEAAKFCGLAPANPPFGMIDHYKLTNFW